MTTLTVMFTVATLILAVLISAFLSTFAFILAGSLQSPPTTGFPGVRTEASPLPMVL